jgi:hypothetical protein
MISINVDTAQMNKLELWAAQASGRLDSAIKRLVKKSVFVVEKHAKYFAPVRTGRLRASIGGGSFEGGSFGEGEGRVIQDRFASIGPTVEYAKFVHRRVPFMYAAAQASKEEIAKIATNEIRDSIR